MQVTRESLDIWIKIAKATNKKYIIVVCDTFSYKYIPILCGTEDEVFERCKRYDDNNVFLLNQIIRINEDKTVTEKLKLTDIKKQ